MQLKDYLSGLPRGTQAQFAKKVGVNPVYLSQLASGKSGSRLFKPSPSLCIRIERNTDHKVTRRDLRPDDHQEIWPEHDQDLANSAQDATETVAQGEANV